MIDTLGLRVLIALKDSGSATAAAETLGYTPSNITQHLRRLERTLGAPTVERVGRGVVLTERAQALAERGRPILLQLDDLASITATQPSGVLDLAAFPTALRGLVVPSVGRLQTTHPGLEIRPHELDPQVATEAVRTGRMHAAVVKTWGPAPPRRRRAETETLDRIPLGKDRIDAVLPVGHRLARKPALSLEDLATDSWAVTPEDDPYRTWLAEHRQPLQLDPPAMYEATEFASLISYVQHGLAVAAIPRLGRGDLPAGVLAIPLTDNTAVRQCSLLVRRSARGGPALEALVEHLSAAAREVLDQR